VTRQFPPHIGGLGHSAERIARQLSRHFGYDVHVLVVDETSDKYFPSFELGNPVNLSMPTIHWLRTMRDWQRSEMASYESLHHLNSVFSFDIVVTFGVSIVGFATTLWGKENGVPVIVSARGKDIHSDIFDPDRFGQIYWCLKHASYIIAVTNTLLRRIRAITGRIDESIFIPNGIDPTVFSEGVVNISNLPRGLVIGTIGVVRPSKGLHLLFQACANLSKKFSFTLLIIGDASEIGREYLDAEMSQWMQHFPVVVTGFVQHSEVLSYLRLTDIVVLPSLYDGFPNALLESMLAERPVIATNSAGEDALEDGEDGLLIQRDSVEALSTAIEQLAINPTLRTKLAVSARNKVLHQYTSHQEAMAWHNVLEMVIGNYLQR